MPVGDFGLYREVGGGTSVGQPGTAIDLDTTDLEESTFSRSGGEVTVKEACRVLCIAGMEAEKDAGAAETALMRIEVDQNTGTFLAEPGSYCQGYFSDINGVASAPMACVTVVDAVALAKIRLFAETKTDSVLESAARTFLQLYRLPASIHVAHIYRSTNLSTIGTTYVDVPWNSEIIKDSLWTHSNSSTPAEVTWTGPASRVLLLFSLTVSNPTGTSPDRLGVGAHLIKNGSDVDFSQVTGHIRGTGDDINVTLRLAMPIDLATNDVLKVQVKVFARPGSQTARVVSNRATMTVLAMPGSQSWLRMRNSANQDADSSSLDFLCNTEDEEGPAFAHSTSSNTSEVTLQRTHRYLLGYKVSIDRGASATADNMAWDSFWRKNNSTDLETRGGGGFSEGTQASVAYRESSITGAVIVSGAGGDIYELRIDKIGTGADSNADFLGGTGETKSLLWALDLDELRPIAGYALAGISSRAAPRVVHSGRARCSPGITERAQAVGSHQGRARCGGGTLERAQASAVHSGRSMAISGAQGRAIGSKTIQARVAALLGVLTRAAPQLTVGGGGGLEILARGRALFGIQARAIAQAVHGARGRALVGAQERAQARVAHVARGRAIAGMVERAAPQGAHQGRGRTVAGVESSASLARGFLARCKALMGVSARAKAAGVHGARSQALVGQTGKAAPSKVSAARGRAEVVALIKAKAQVVHRARARTLAGVTGRVPITPESAVGFYERTSKRVRQRLKSVAGALAIQFPNLPFTEPQGAIWARAWVNFDEIDALQYGSGVASYRVPGELILDLRAPLQGGKKALLALAGSLGELLEQSMASGIVYAAAKVGQARDAGADEYRLTLCVPFHAEDSGFARVEPGPGDGDDSFDGAERAIRARFKDQLPDVPASYDNLPATTGATWVRLRIDESDSWDVDGVRRTAGVMTAEVHVPLQRGERSALQIADRIVGAFRLVDAGGVKFAVPYLQSGRQALDEWIMPVYAPWTIDRA